ncbi:type II toxin-antitoxin system VapC family toxin [Ferrovibrio sp.]|uniref:type II toxin-antitoxin system VapC family toxin n=1 Tax=Ferrovibrio sp. TaxID=1917215 RepID=UPI00262BAAF2|nr:type II toxin-antitoxin system VapC family toxin [Ferrovibrio sp.]
MILDSSVIIAILRDEPEASQFREALTETGDALRMSAASYLEAAIVVDGSRNPILSRELDQLFGAVGLVIEPVTEKQARIAREAYRDFGKGSGHPAQLNFGDCFAYALAKDLGEPLLFKGEDFHHTDVRPALA